MPTKPDLEVWDSCCLTGILNNEKDKVPALLSRTHSFEQGEAILGIPIVVIGEVVALSDGTPAKDKVERFLQNPYVETLVADKIGHTQPLSRQGIGKIEILVGISIASKVAERRSTRLWLTRKVEIESHIGFDFGGRTID